MNETAFSQDLMRRFFTGPDTHAQRLEVTSGSGVPDISVCIQGVEVWVETKVFTPRGSVLLRPFQRAWMHRRCKAGGRCFVLAFMENSGLVYIWRYKDIEVEQQGDYLSIISKFTAVFPLTPENKTKLLELLKS